MSERFKKIITELCAVGVALNTAMFAINLYEDLHRFAIFNLLCAAGCWIGYFFYQEGEKNDNGQ